MRLRLVIFAVGAVACFSRLVWGAFADANVEPGLVATLLFAWHLLPFALLAVAYGETPLSRTGAVAGLAGVTMGTVVLDVELLLVTDDAQAPIALVLAPIWLAAAVGPLIGVDSAVRAVGRLVGRA
jgi:hypothetical protein